ncbi:radical SAM/SPASM domain-containing protein [Chloroflexota bacterium]
MPRKVEFPRSILVETTLRCPADCVFCPNKKVQGRPLDMSWDLFKKVVDECRGKGLQEFCPFIHGEPLAYPRIENALDYLSHNLPETPIQVYTNGYLLDRQKISLLLGSNLGGIHFSIDGVSKEVYERHRRGLDYGRVMANILGFLDSCRKAQREIDTRVVLTLTPENDAEIEAFRLLWNGLVDVVDVIPCDGRGGEGRLPAAPEARMLGCLHVPYRTYILSDGSVVPCCKDWAGYTVMGNVARESLQSIWDSTVYRRFREEVGRGIFSNFEVCSRCISDSL